MGVLKTNKLKYFISIREADKWWLLIGWPCECILLYTNHILGRTSQSQPDMGIEDGWLSSICWPSTCLLVWLFHQPASTQAIFQVQQQLTPGQILPYFILCYFKWNGILQYDPLCARICVSCMSGTSSLFKWPFRTSPEKNSVFLCSLIVAIGMHYILLTLNFLAIGDNKHTWTLYELSCVRNTS